VILGASFDTVTDNAAFALAQRLPFPVLSDVDRRVGTAYEVVRPGGDRLAAFPERHSYLIGPDGVIARSYSVSDVSNHAESVLVDLRQLRGANR
jgi:peroxiredoxin